MKPIRENFTLSKIKYKDNGLCIDFGFIDTIDGEPYVNNGSITKTQIPTPDFKMLLNDLKPMLAKTWHYDFMSTAMNEKGFNANNIQKGIVNRIREELYRKISINGIAFSGSGDNEGVVILGAFKSDSNKVMAMNSPRVVFSVACYGFEEELDELSDKLLDEAYKYLFENNYGQLELFSVIDPEEVEHQKEAS